MYVCIKVANLVNLVRKCKILLNGSDEQYVLISAANGGLSCCGANSHTEILTAKESCLISKSGTVGVNLNMLMILVNSLEEEHDIELKLNDQALTFADVRGMFKYQLDTVKTSLVPIKLQCTNGSSARSWISDADEMFSTLKYARKFVEPDLVTELGCIHFNLDGDKDSYIVASDGYALLSQRISSGTIKGNGKFTLPCSNDTPFVDYLLDMLKLSNGTVLNRFNDTMLQTFLPSGDQVKTKLVEADYPEWKGFIDLSMKQAKELRFSRENLYRTLTRMDSIKKIDIENRGLLTVINDGVMTLSTQSNYDNVGKIRNKPFQGASASEQIEYKSFESNLMLELRIEPALFLKFLSNLSDEDVMFYVTNAEQPVVVTADNVKAIIMPKKY